MNKILVTGGAGFIGTNLCNYLVSDSNNYVLCLDNFATGSVDNIKNLQSKDNFKLISHNIHEYIDIEVDQIYHAACPASPIKYQKEPIDVIKTCFLGTLNILNLCKKYSAKMMHFSTSEIYGNPSVHPQTEDYWGYVNPIGIRSCYDEGKRIAETLCYDYFRQYNLDIKIIRIFNTYGPYMCKDDGRVIINFIINALNNKPICIYGDGKQTRSFQYVDDLINGIVTYMSLDKLFIGPINLGNPEEISILDLAMLIIKKTNSKSKIVFLDRPQDDPIRRKPDVSLAKKVLDGWNSQIDLDEGLERIIKFYQSVK